MVGRSMFGMPINHCVIRFGCVSFDVLPGTGVGDDVGMVPTKVAVFTSLQYSHNIPTSRSFLGSCHSPLPIPSFYFLYLVVVVRVAMSSSSSSSGHGRVNSPTSRVGTFKLEGFIKPYLKSSRDFDHG